MSTSTQQTKYRDGIYIAHATPEQIPIIQEIAGICYPVAYKGIHSDEQNLYMMQQMYSTTTLQTQMLGGHTHYLLLYIDGIPSGYCAYKPHPTEPSTIYLDKLYILPSIKGKGYGRLLVEQVMEQAARLYPQGYTIRLDVNRSNSARAFYEHLGFRVIRSWDAPIGHGYFMNAFEMALARS